MLITSQNPHWPGPAMDVPVLAPDVAAGFLINRTGDPDRTAARDLAGMLGGLPLALEQAAAYIQATGMTLAGYLPLFRDRRRTCWPAASRRAPGECGGHLGPGLVPAGGRSAAGRGRAAAAAGLLAPEPVPLALLLAGAQVAGAARPGRRGHGRALAG